MEWSGGGRGPREEAGPVVVGRNDQDLILGSTDRRDGMSAEMFSVLFVRPLPWFICLARMTAYRQLTIVNSILRRKWRIGHELQRQKRWAEGRGCAVWLLGRHSCSRHHE